MYENEFTEETLQNGLRNLIEGTASDDDDILWENLRVHTFDEAGVMSRDAGLVITLPDGTEFQLTIVQSR